jgi:hypothetical protein
VLRSTARAGTDQRHERTLHAVTVRFSERDRCGRYDADRDGRP